MTEWYLCYRSGNWGRSKKDWTCLLRLCIASGCDATVWNEYIQAAPLDARRERASLHKPVRETRWDSLNPHAFVCLVLVAQAWWPLAKFVHRLECRNGMGEFLQLCDHQTNLMCWYRSRDGFSPYKRVLFNHTKSLCDFAWTIFRFYTVWEPFRVCTSMICHERD